MHARSYEQELFMRGTLCIAGLLACVALFGIGYAVVHFSRAAPIQARSVLLTDDGFVPEAITVRAGDSVTFRTQRPQPFWPSANPHPTHALYPEFDAGRPVPSTESWTFVFERVGVWPYHDFLRPYFTGSIYVTE